MSRKIISCLLIMSFVCGRGEEKKRKDGLKDLAGATAIGTGFCFTPFWPLGVGILGVVGVATLRSTSRFEEEKDKNRLDLTIPDWLGRNNTDRGFLKVSDALEELDKCMKNLGPIIRPDKAEGAQKYLEDVMKEIAHKNPSSAQLKQKILAEELYKSLWVENNYVKNSYFGNIGNIEDITYELHQKPKVVLQKILIKETKNDDGKQVSKQENLNWPLFEVFVDQLLPDITLVQQNTTQRLSAQDNTKIINYMFSIRGWLNNAEEPTDSVNKLIFSFVKTRLESYETKLGITTEVKDTSEKSQANALKVLKLLYPGPYENLVSLGSFDNISLAWASNSCPMTLKLLILNSITESDPEKLGNFYQKIVTTYLGKSHSSSVPAQTLTGLDALNEHLKDLRYIPSNIPAELSGTIDILMGKISDPAEKLKFLKNPYVDYTLFWLNQNHSEFNNNVTTMYRKNRTILDSLAMAKRTGFTFATGRSIL